MRRPRGGRKEAAGKLYLGVWGHALSPCMVAAKQLETSACKRQVQTIRKVRGVGPGSRDPGSGIRDLSPKVAKSNMLQSRRPERPRSSRDHHSKPLGAIYRSSTSTF